MPHVGPLDTVTFKEAALFTCNLDPVTCKEALPLSWVYGYKLDPRRDLTTQKVRVANKNHEKSNIIIS